MAKPNKINWIEWVSQFKNRDQCASAYAMLIYNVEHDRLVFMEINGAIVRRWSEYALIYIKRKAWRKVNDMRRVDRARRSMANG